MSMMSRPSLSATSRCADFSSGACVHQYATITPSIGSSGRCAVSRSATMSASARVAGLSSISIPATSSTITPRCIQRSIWRAKIRLRWLQRSVIARPNATVHHANDADMAGLGEFHHGAGRGTRNMVYITWSTGVGGGLIFDGKLHRGAHGTAGEVGHMIIDPNGPLDNCGQRGCLEAFVGGRALEREFGRPAVELFAGAARGQRNARMIVERAARHMGTALISLTNRVEPAVFVIGGGGD